MMVQEQLKTPGEIITFYSYKGGTGRSMALANVACLLAKHSNTNEKVLMIDWDLEAPGLHWFFHENFKKFFAESNNYEQTFKNHPGLIDLFEKLKDDIKRPDFTGDNEETVQTLINKFDFQPFILETDILPNLYLIKAGCFNENYSNKVNTFQWVDFYNKAPSLFRFLSERLMEDYKYVLIDSRTGVSDTSGICTMLMPEKLVTVFTPNRQSLEGVPGLIKQAIDYRKQSDDLRPLVVFPLPSRIEASEVYLRRIWRFGEESKQMRGYQKEFEQLFQEIYGFGDAECSLENYFNEVQIQQLPQYAYGEEIAVLSEKQEDRLSLTRSYETFIEKLLKFDSPWEDTDTKHKPDDLRSDKKIDYTPLRNLLEQELWKYADEETQTVMLKAVGREKEGNFENTSIENFPCTDLRTIDQLWVKYSGGRFGFSVQKRIWENVDKNYGKFAVCVGWDKIINYRELTFSIIDAPQGHLPGWGAGLPGGAGLVGAGYLWNLSLIGFGGRGAWLSSLASRLVDCNI
jgi:cellulose biosynthesis protein BcsQ